MVRAGANGNLHMRTPDCKIQLACRTNKIRDRGLWISGEAGRLDFNRQADFARFRSWPLALSGTKAVEPVGYTQFAAK